MAALLAVQPHYLGGGGSRTAGVNMTWRRLLAAWPMRQWWSQLEEIDREARHFRVGVRGGVEQAVLRARVHHEAGNWLILTKSYNAVRRPLACRRSRRSSQMLRRETRPYILPNGFGGAAKYRMFQRSAARGRHGPGVVLHTTVASTEAVP